VSKAKRNSLLFLSAAGVLALILAMSLPNLVLSPGQPFSLGQSHGPDSGSGGDLPGENALIWIFRGIIGLALILLPLHLVLSLLTSEGRQRLLADAIVIAGLLMLATYLDKHPLSQNNQQQQPAVSSPTNLEQGPALPINHFPANPPPWLAPTVILAVSALAAVVVLVVIRYLRARAQLSVPSLQRLAETAQNTLESLQAGGDFGVIVIRCYREMSRVVKEERGMARETAMTPREFEAQLVSSGLPHESVGTLTRLFEQVRYGSIALSDREEKLAVSCLTDIVTACKTVGVRQDG
jgi:hypothetical protein